MSAQVFSIGEVVRWRGKPVPFRIVRLSTRTTRGQQVYVVEFAESPSGDYLAWEEELSTAGPSR